MTEGENGDNELTRAVKEMSRTETEIEIIKQKMQENERQIKSFKENSADSKSVIETL